MAVTPCDPTLFGQKAERPPETVLELVDRQVSAANQMTVQGQLRFTLYQALIPSEFHKLAGSQNDLSSVYAQLIRIVVQQPSATLQQRVGALRILAGMPRLDQQRPNWDDLIKPLLKEAGELLGELRPSLESSRKFGLGKLKYSFFSDPKSQIFLLENYLEGEITSAPKRWKDILLANGMSEQLRMLLELTHTVLAIAPKGYIPATEFALTVIELMIKDDIRFPRAIAFYYGKPNIYNHYVFAFGYEGLPRIASALLLQGGDAAIRGLHILTRRLDGEVPPIDVVDEEEEEEDSFVVDNDKFDSNEDNPGYPIDPRMMSKGPMYEFSRMFHILAAAFRELRVEIPVSHLLYQELSVSIHKYEAMVRDSMGSELRLDPFTDSCVRMMLWHNYLFERAKLGNQQTELTRFIQAKLAIAEFEGSRPFTAKEFGPMRWYVQTLLEIGNSPQNFDYSYDAKVALFSINKALSDVEKLKSTHPVQARSVLEHVVLWLRLYKSGQFATLFQPTLKSLITRSKSLCAELEVPEIPD